MTRIAEVAFGQVMSLDTGAMLHSTEPSYWIPYVSMSRANLFRSFERLKTVEALHEKKLFVTIDGLMQVTIFRQLWLSKNTGKWTAVGLTRSRPAGFLSVLAFDTTLDFTRWKLLGFPVNNILSESNEFHD